MSRLKIATIRKMIDTDIPMYEMYVRAGAALEGAHSSCLKQMSCK